MGREEKNIRRKCQIQKMSKFEEEKMNHTKNNVNYEWRRRKYQIRKNEKNSMRDTAHKFGEHKIKHIKKLCKLEAEKEEAPDLKNENNSMHETARKLEEEKTKHTKNYVS